MTFSPSSQLALYLSVFLSCVSFAIVMPTLWPYLSTLHSPASFLALVVASYSVGEALGALLFGRLSNILSTRSTMLLATVCGFLGSFLYILAEPYPTLLGRYLVLAGRVLQGMWTGGAQALQPVYLAAVLPRKELTPKIVSINAYACLGFVVGPVFGLVFDVVPRIQVSADWSVNPLTAPGYFVLASAVAVGGLFVGVFDEEGDREGGVREEWEQERGETLPLLERKEEAAVGTWTVPIVLCNAIFFVHFFGFALQETITTPLVQALYGWSVLSANLLFTGAGVCALLTFLLLTPLSRVCSDRFLTASSLALGALGYILLIPLPQGGPPAVWRFLAGFAAISVAFPMGRATTVSLYTKLLPQREQGGKQGVLLAVGAVARVLGPFWAVRGVGEGRGVVFGGVALAFGGCWAVMRAFYKGLQG